MAEEFAILLDIENLQTSLEHSSEEDYLCYDRKHYTIECLRLMRQLKKIIESDIKCMILEEETEISEEVEAEESETKEAETTEAPRKKARSTISQV